MSSSCSSSPLPISRNGTLIAIPPHPPPAAAAPAPPTQPNIAASITLKPSDFIDRFHVGVRTAKNGALFVAGFHLLSRFLGFCALTWATVVLLGGFASALRTYDFFLISALLLLDGTRLFIVQIFSKLLSKLTLFRESHRPENFEFKDMQHIKASRLDIIGQTISSLLAFASLISTVVRFSLKRRHALSGIGSSNDSKNTNLSNALYTFYVLVLVNSSFAVLSALLNTILRWQCNASPLSDQNGHAVRQNWLVHVHDEVIRTAMDVGLAEADQLDILEFAFTKLSSDYKRNIRPPLIKAQNRDLIRYLYHSQQGIAMSCEHLKSSSDVWKQVVAANLPGFWVGEQRIEMQLGLLWALGERIHGAGKDAESALNSIECLGQAWADLPKTKQYPFLLEDPAIASSSIVSRLVRLLLNSIRPTLLFQLRAFEACCRNPQVLQHMYGGRSPQEGEEMCRKLQDMLVAEDQLKGVKIEDGDGELQLLCCKLAENVKSEGVWMTTKIYAGSALLALLSYGSEKGLSSETIKSLKEPVEKFIDPAKERTANGERPYFWLNDMLLVEQIRRKLGMERYGKRWEGVRIRSADSGAELSFNEVQDYFSTNTEERAKCSSSPCSNNMPSTSSSSHSSASTTTPSNCSQSAALSIG